MDIHARQQFDFFFEKLRTDPNGEGVWLDEFTAALFRDFLLDNDAGSAFILQALARRPNTATLTPDMTVEQAMSAMARSAFAAVLRIKTDEQLEQRLAFQVVDE
jgi:hypothetical protein